MARPRIPEVAVRRLPVYLRVLNEVRAADVDVVSSAELARRTGFSSEQIRKDLAYFGAFGTRGVGYDTGLLSDRLSQILGLDKGVKVAVVGAGNLGTALARYNIQRHPDVQIAAVFDSDWDKIGKKIEDIEISPMEDLREIVSERGIKMAIIAVPGPAARKVAEQLVDAGIEAILNFSPAKIDLDKPVFVQNIDLSIELQSLAYYVSDGNRRNRNGS